MILIAIPPDQRDKLIEETGESLLLFFVPKKYKKSFSTVSDKKRPLSCNNRPKSVKPLKSSDFKALTDFQKRIECVHPDGKG